VGEGWEIRHDGRHIASYQAREVRLSILWKGYVFKDEAHLASFEDPGYDLDLDKVVEIFGEDLAARGISCRHPSDPLADDEWRQQLERTYVTPFDL
jgi:hypothetical protein